MVGLAESINGSIHHLIFHYLGLISQILKPLLELQMQKSKVWIRIKAEPFLALPV